MHTPPTTISTAPTTAAGVLEVSTPIVTAPWNTVLLPVAMPTHTHTPQELSGNVLACHSGRLDFKLLSGLKIFN